MNTFLRAIVVFFLISAPAFGADGSQLQQDLAALRTIGSTFSFVVLGDTRAGDPACEAVYQKIITSAMERKPHFVLNTGDQINEPGNREHWKRFRELSKTITVPYFLTVGNHDVQSRVAGSEEAWKAEVELPGNERYYSFVAGNSLFVILDSSVSGQEKRITGEQFAWLQQVLSGSTQKHKFVFVHHPLFPERGIGKHYGNSLDRYRTERDRLQALFSKHKVSMVFLGHEHLYLRKKVDGVSHVIAGGGGAPLYTAEESGGFHHLVQVFVDGDKVTVETVDINGRIRDKF